MTEEGVVELMGQDVRKYIIQPGSGLCADIGTVVICDLVGFIYSFEASSRQNNVPFENLVHEMYEIGEGDTFPGLELALRHSKEGEHFRLFCRAKFAFGPIGRKASTAEPNSAVPPHSDFEYEVKIIKHLRQGELDPEMEAKFKKLTLECNNETARSEAFNRIQTMQSMMRRKHAGNKWFSFGELDRACRAYAKATKISSGYFKRSDETEQSLVECVENSKNHDFIEKEDFELLALHVDCLNNLSLCKLLQKEFSQAKELCIQVLQFSPLNFKALLRAAKATLALDAFEECEACLHKLSASEDIDLDLKYRAAVEHEYKNLAKAKQEYKLKSKSINTKIAKKLFKSMELNAPKDTLNVNVSASDTCDTNQPLADQGEEKQEVREIKLQNKGVMNSISLRFAFMAIVISVVYMVYLAMYN